MAVRQTNRGRKSATEKSQHKKCGQKNHEKKKCGRKSAAEKWQQHGWGLFMRDMAHLV
jgi:hypothetical protein